MWLPGRRSDRCGSDLSDFRAQTKSPKERIFKRSHRQFGNDSTGEFKFKFNNGGRWPETESFRNVAGRSGNELTNYQTMNSSKLPDRGVQLTLPPSSD